MRKIILIGLGVSVLTVLLSVITAGLMAQELPTGLGPSAVSAVASSHHLVRLPGGELGLLYFDALGAYHVLYVSSEDNGATWTSPDTLNTGTYILMIEPPDLVVRPDSYVFAVWDAADSTRADSLGNYYTDIFFAYRDPTGVWNTPSRLAVGIGYAAGPRVALTPDGDVHVVWYDEVGDSSNIYYSSTSAFSAADAHAGGISGGIWSPPVVIDDTDEYAQTPALVSDDDGRLHLTYAEIIDKVTEDDLADELRYQVSTDGGSDWSASSAVSANGGVQSTRGVAQASLVARPDSTVHVVWLDDDLSGDRDVFSASQSAGGSWSTPLNVTGADSAEAFPSLAADVDGRLDLYYEALPSGMTVKDIYHRYRAAGGGSWSPAVNVSQSDTLDTRAPGIVAEPIRAGTMAAWVERTTTGAPVRYGIEFKLSEDEVWPGDTNNDGTVNADDVVPLAAYWGDTAPARSGSGQTVWSAHPVASSLSVAHGFADANGDGVVGAHDVLPIGLNWGRTHATRGPSYIPPVAALDAEALAAAVREIRATLASAGSGPAAEMIRVLDALIASSAEGATETGAGTGSLAASPNPTDGMTRVHFRLPQAGRVTVAIYDARGRLVRSVLDEERAQGNGEALWDGLDGRGIAAPAGLYFARIEAPGVRMSEKILRVK